MLKGVLSVITSQTNYLQVEIDDSTKEGLEIIAKRCNISVEHLCKTIIKVCIEDHLLDGVLDLTS